MSKSISSPAAGKSTSKPAKPYPDFPLFPHATKRWAKKIRGKLHYFGPWHDPDGSLSKYLDQRDDLHAGRAPRLIGEGLTIRDLMNRFLTVKQHLVDTGELMPRSFADYYATCERIVTAFGKSRLVADLASGDFEALRGALAKVRGPVALGNEVQRVRVVFKYAYDAGLIDRPVRYGPTFKRPSKRVLRLHRQSKGKRMLEAKQIEALLEAANVPMKAMVLLGINCGFGNADVARLPLAAIDFNAGWITYPRPKTGVERRCPMCPETAAAIKAAITARPEPRDKSDAGLVFITKRGLSWSKDSSDNPVSKEFSKLLKEQGFQRPGLNFYALRHTFETIGGESKDQVAVDHIMGHARDDMATAYREGISDERLQAVTHQVHAWLFGK